MLVDTSADMLGGRVAAWALDRGSQWAWAVSPLSPLQVVAVAELVAAAAVVEVGEVGAVDTADM